MARFEYTGSQFSDDALAGGGADSLFELGLRYSIGRDVESDLVQAHKWFNLAALRGNQEARRYRSEISAEMTRQQISIAQRMAREWLSRT